MEKTPLKYDLYVISVRLLFYRKRRHTSVVRPESEVEIAKLLLFKSAEEREQPTKLPSISQQSQVFLQIPSDPNYTTESDTLTGNQIDTSKLDPNNPLTKTLRKRLYSRKGDYGIRERALLAPAGMPFVPEPSLQFLHADDIEKLGKAIPHCDPRVESPRNILYKARQYIKLLQEEIRHFRDKANYRPLKSQPFQASTIAVLAPIRKLPPAPQPNVDAQPVQQ